MATILGFTVNESNCNALVNDLIIDELQERCIMLAIWTLASFLGKFLSEMQIVQLHE